MTSEELCTKLIQKLAQDALRIASTHINPRELESTTCLCVVLADQDQRAKKFVFHNKEKGMSPSMRDKAEELGYDIINAEQAHAEGEFIQHLLARKQQNPARYTHILGIGSSRRHCPECDSLFKLFLGQGYNKLTAAMHVVPSENIALPL